MSDSLPKITEADLKGDCLRLNTILGLLQNAIAQSQTTTQSTFTIGRSSGANVYRGTDASRRLLIPDDGAAFIVTDRNNVVYQWQVDHWVYVDGQMSGTAVTVDQRPTDLGAYDVGFQFYATDTFTIYVWDGTVWDNFREMGSLLANTHANRATRAPGDFPVDAQFFETDRKALYRNTGVLWVLMRTLYHRCTQATLPADLGADDEGFLACVTDFRHVLEWDGTGWIWGPGEDGAHAIHALPVDPDDTTGWQFCDGTTVDYLNGDGTTSSYATPDLTSVANLAAFLELAGTVSGPTAAAAPTFTPPTVNSATTGLTVNSNVTGLSASTAATGTTQPVQAGAGATVPTAAHVHGVGTADPGHNHAVTDPGHVHTLAGGSVGADGEPRKISLRPWFRK